MNEVTYKWFSLIVDVVLLTHMHEGIFLHSQQPPKLREEEHQEEDANIRIVDLLIKLEKKNLEGNSVVDKHVV
jgi:hypothetical protein